MNLQFEVRLPSSLEAVRKTAALLRAALADQVSERDCALLEMAVCELLNNVVEHGCAVRGPLEWTLRLEFREEDLRLEVTDNGRPYDVTRYRRPRVDPEAVDCLPTGGMGLPLIHDAMDSVEYRRVGDRNVVRLERKVHRKRKLCAEEEGKTSASQAERHIESTERS